MARAASSRARRLTPEQVRKDKRWGPLLRSHIPKWDPCAMADGYVFDVQAAEEVLDFFPQVIRHAQPPVSGQPFKLEPWQQSFLANLFGWKHAKTGLRRFKTANLYVPKKNTKTELVAGVVLYVMHKAPDGAQLFGAASSQQQAGLLADHAFGMVRQHEEMRQCFTVYGDKGGTVKKSLVFHERMVSFKILQADADTVDGVGPYLVVIDELHRHPDGELASVLVKGTASQREPIIIYTSTADYDRESPCNALLKRSREVRDNGGDPAKPGYDPTFLPAIWEASKDDNWESLETWKKANPNFGVSVTETYALEQIQLARENPIELNDLLRLHLNIVVGVAGGWLVMPKWDKASPRLKLVPALDEHWIQDLALTGRRCFVAADLGKTSDLTSVARVFPPLKPDEDWVVLMRYWMPQEKLIAAEKRDKVPFSLWAREGWLHATEGDVMDYDVMKAHVVQFAKDVEIVKMGYDPWNATQTALQLQGEGIPMEEFRQGAKSYNEGCNRLVDLIAARRLAHGHNPVLRWNASNVVVKKDENGNIYPSKKRSTGRIDGITALCMALALAILNEQIAAQVLDEAYKPGEGLYV